MKLLECIVVVALLPTMSPCVIVFAEVKFSLWSSFGGSTVAGTLLGGAVPDGAYSGARSASSFVKCTVQSGQWLCFVQ